MARIPLKISVKDTDAQKVYDALAAGYSVTPDAAGAQAALAMMVAGAVASHRTAVETRAADDARAARIAARQAAGQPVEDTVADRVNDAVARAGIDVTA